MFPEGKPGLIIRGIPFKVGEEYASQLMQAESEVFSRTLPEATKMLRRGDDAIEVVSFVLNRIGQTYPVREAYIVTDRGHFGGFHSPEPVRNPGAIAIEAVRYNYGFLTGQATEAVAVSHGGYSSNESLVINDVFDDLGAGVVVYDRYYHFASGSTAVGFGSVTSLHAVHGTLATRDGSLSYSGPHMDMNPLCNAIGQVRNTSAQEVADSVTYTQSPGSGLIVVTHGTGGASIATGTQMNIGIQEISGNWVINTLRNP